MSALVFNPNVTYPNPASEPYQLPPYQPGQRGRTDDGNEYVFVQAAEAITAHHACEIDNEWLVRAVRDRNGSRDGRAIGVPAMTVSNHVWFWIQVLGHCSLNVNANCAAYAHLYTTSTNGRLDQTQSNQDRIRGLVTTSSRGGTVGTVPAVMASYPYYD